MLQTGTDWSQKENKNAPPEIVTTRPICTQESFAHYNIIILYILLSY